MVTAFHCVFSVRGFWPPNDPRGSWSTHVWAKHLQRFEDAQKVNVRLSITHDRSLKREIKAAMLYPQIHLNAPQIEAVARGIADIVAMLHLKVYDCAILQDHVHFFPARHAEDVETPIGYLKRAASRALNEASLHPLQKFIDKRKRLPSMWVRGGWKRFLSSPDKIEDAIEYVRSNPARHDLPSQQWSFETPFVYLKTR